MGKVIITVGQVDGGLAIPVDSRFGRAERFMVVDLDSGDILQTVSNPYFDAPQGAGTGAASLMRALGAEVVVSGRFGPKAVHALEQSGVRMVSVEYGTTVDQALNLLRESDDESTARVSGQ